MWRRGSRNERGITAVVVAISALMLFSVAALAVDLGNAYARKRSVQSQADFAAFAGGAADNLPATQAAPRATDKAVIAVATYLNKNQPQDDAATADVCEAARTCVTAPMLVDGSRANGEVYYGHFVGASLVPSLNELTVYAPNAQVDYGLAGVMGFDSVNVQARATVAIKSGKVKALPFYTYNGCDYGPQTISEPNNGHAVDTVLLSHGTETNTATLSSLSPAGIALGDASSSLTINGTNLDGVTHLGFFESGDGSPGPEPVISTTAVTVTGTTKVELSAPLPSQVTSVQGVWYVRVRKSATGPWSAVIGSGSVLNAPPLTVGTPVLTCAQGSNDGNFGTLKLQGTGQATEVAENIARGLDQLGIFPNAASNWECSASMTGAKLWPADGTNCVGTKAGMAQSAATLGLVTGVNGYPGLLTNVSAGSGCAASGIPATKVFLQKTINNDTLSCFFTSATTNIGQIDSPTYALPGPVLASAVWKSPRMVFAPVLGVVPGSGASNKYQIIGFRPGFITDQTNSATKTTVATANNGLTPSGSDVQSVQIVFFNTSALPTPPEGTAVTDYLPGSGSKILRLID